MTPSISCVPFPNGLSAYLTPRGCLFNQAGGKIQACASCPTGAQVARDYPELVAGMQVRKVEKFNTWPPLPPEKPAYQQKARARITGNIKEARAKRRYVRSAGQEVKVPEVQRVCRCGKPSYGKAMECFECLTGIKTAPVGAQRRKEQ